MDNFTVWMASVLVSSLTDGQTGRQSVPRMSQENDEDRKLEPTPANGDEDNEEAFELVPESEAEVHRRRADELFERLQRLQADFDNYRKRMDARFEESRRYASEGILLKLLDIYDNLERALDVDFERNPVGAREGVAAIKQQMETLLAQEGVRRMEPLGKPFDPYYQHSVNKVNDPDQPDGIVVEVYQHGYMLREKVLRPALVCVNRHESDGSASPSSEANTVSEGDGE